MSVGEKLLGILKMTGLTALLFAGTILEGIGIPLHFAGKSKKAEALEAFQNSAEYQVMREAEDRRLDNYRDKLEQIEVQYQAGEMFSDEYNLLKQSYEDEIKKSDENFFMEAFEKTADSEVKGILKSAEAMNIASIVLMVLGGGVYFLKGSLTTGASIENGELVTTGGAIIEGMENVISYDFQPEWYVVEDRKKKKEERKKQKEEKDKKKQGEDEEDFLDEEGVEELSNIEDTYYKE